MHGRRKSLAPQSKAWLQLRIPYLKQFVARHFPPAKDAAILDLGCGYGALLHVLNLADYTNALGVDASPEQVNTARSLGIEGVEQQDLMSALDRFAPEALDVIVTFDVIEHLTKPELFTLVEKVRQRLKPDGRWIIHAPNGESPFAGRMRYGDITHAQAFTRTSLTQLLMNFGFTEVLCFEDRPVPHGIISFSRYLLWRMIRCVLLFYCAVETGSFDRKAVFSQNLVAIAYR